MKTTKILAALLGFLLMVNSNVALAQETTESDLVGKWNLTKVEVLNMQGETELGRQTFDALSIDSGKANFGHVVEIDQIECSADRKTIYRGQDKGSPFIRNGNIQISVQTPLFTVIHFHNGFWSDVNLVWIDKPTSFMLISEQLIDQAYDYREQVWLYYTKEFNATSVEEVINDKDYSYKYFLLSGKESNEIPIGVPFIEMRYIDNVLISSNKRFIEE